MNEKIEFSNRLRQAMKDAGYAVSPSVLEQEFKNTVEGQGCRIYQLRQKPLVILSRTHQLVNQIEQRLAAVKASHAIIKAGLIWAAAQHMGVEQGQVGFVRTGLHIFCGLRKSYHQRTACQAAVVHSVESIGFAVGIWRTLQHVVVNQRNKLLIIQAAITLAKFLR